jgi:pimeloyl-ACP methyl ester carboxylesterase
MNPTIAFRHPATGAPAPSLALLGAEPMRAALEYAGMRLMNKKALPAGDGHPIVIFPGLASDRRATAPLKTFCDELGYTAYDWGRGFNTGPQGDPDIWLDDLSEHVARLVERHDERVSLIGWSLGGIYAREVAKRLRDKTRQVITIGTPFAGTAEQSNVGLVYRLLNGRRPDLDDALRAELATAPPVPTTSIYSKSDGIVAWQTCIQQAGRSQTDNVEVGGSHCGMGWNPSVLKVIADRLSQPDGSWQPYAAPTRWPFRYV